MCAINPTAPLAMFPKRWTWLGGTAGRLLRKITDEGVIIHSRESVQYIYRAIPYADIPDVILPCMVE